MEAPNGASVPTGDGLPRGGTRGDLRVGMWCYRVGVGVRKLSIALEESVAVAAARAAEERGVSLSAWVNAAAVRALQVEAGLAAVGEWEVQHGRLSEEELAWADSVLDAVATEGR